MKIPFDNNMLPIIVSEKLEMILVFAKLKNSRKAIHTQNYPELVVPNQKIFLKLKKNYVPIRWYFPLIKGRKFAEELISIEDTDGTINILKNIRRRTEKCLEGRDGHIGNTLY